jgi:hypothetical protein
VQEGIKIAPDVWLSSKNGLSKPNSHGFLELMQRTLPILPNLFYATTMGYERQLKPLKRSSARAGGNCQVENFIAKVTGDLSSIRYIFRGGAFGPQYGHRLGEAWRGKTCYRDARRKNKIIAHIVGHSVAPRMAMRPKPWTVVSARSNGPDLSHFTNDLGHLPADDYDWGRAIIRGDVSFATKIKGNQLHSAVLQPGDCVSLKPGHDSNESDYCQIVCILVSGERRDSGNPDLGIP